MRRSIDHPSRRSPHPSRPGAPAASVLATRLVLVGIAVLAASPVVAQQTAGEVETRGCLWEATRADRPGSSIFILGSLHVTPPDVYPLPAAIDSAYALSETVVFEADLDSLTSPAFQMAMLGAGTYEGDTSLESALDDTTYARLRSQVESMGLSMTMFSRMKPWLCAVSLTGVELMKLGFDPANGIDMHVHERAKEDGKTIVGLESPAFQLGLFADLDARQSELMLLRTLVELEQLDTMVDDLLDAWRRGDLEKLDGMLLDSFEAFPEMLEIFLTDRNERWVPQLVELAAGGDDLLVVVGAGHLVGPKGVLALLEERGYEIVQR
ncbi:MAG: TraB/GumN family protein [Candidatus Eiseniibacteriota bacterium]|jgi:hypothetical protein